MSAVPGWLLFFLVSFPAHGDGMQQISPVEFLRQHRCISLSGYLNIQGIPRHRCVINCIERNDCEFMNYNVSARHCQLGTGMCEGKISDDTTELIIFGSMGHSAGVRLIPGNQFDASMLPTMLPADNKGGQLAVLINDEYYIPGSFKYLLNSFYAPLERADASGRDVIRSNNPEEIFVLAPEDGYEFIRTPLKTGTPGALVDDGAVVGGFQTMADGTIASLYSLYVSGAFGTYNSVTGNAYTVSTVNPLDTTFQYPLVAKKKLWSTMWSMLSGPSCDKTLFPNSIILHTWAANRCRNNAVHFLYMYVCSVEYYLCFTSVIVVFDIVFVEIYNNGTSIYIYIYGKY